MANPVEITVNPDLADVTLDVDRMAEFYRRWNIDIRVSNKVGRKSPSKRPGGERVPEKICDTCGKMKDVAEFRQHQNRTATGAPRGGQRVSTCMTCEAEATIVCTICEEERPEIEFRGQKKDSRRKVCATCKKNGAGPGPKAYIDWTRKPCRQCATLVRLEEFPVSPKGRILWVCRPCLDHLAIEKSCRLCGETKPASEFERHEMALGGRRHECRTCLKARRRAVRGAKGPKPA